MSFTLSGVYLSGVDGDFNSLRTSLELPRACENTWSNIDHFSDSQIPDSNKGFDSAVSFKLFDFMEIRC